MIDLLNGEDCSSVPYTTDSHYNTYNGKSSISSGDSNAMSESDSYRSIISNQNNYKSNNHRKSSLKISGSTLTRHQSQKDVKKRMIMANVGEPTDDTHECVRCLRAIMSHMYGLNVVIANQAAINSIALCLKHKQFRYKFVKTLFIFTC